VDGRGTKHGILLVGHGTRDHRGVQDFLALGEDLSRMTPDLPVVPCFLEMGRPTIREGVECLVALGTRRIAAMPLMLFAARHVRRDIPDAVNRAIRGGSEIEVRFGPHLGCQQRIAELSARRYHEALAARPAVPADETILVMVGRGSRDAEATAEMGRFVELRGQATPVAEVCTAFLAMAEPGLGEVLQHVGRKRPRRVVVQPHLLFPGALAARVDRAVDRIRTAHPAIDWLVTETLGPDRLVAETVVEGVESTGFWPGGRIADPSCRSANPAGKVSDRTSSLSQGDDPLYGGSCRPCCGPPSGIR
jgi:sirohydrochlorin cobaltochelatase